MKSFKIFINTCFIGEGLFSYFRVFIDRLMFYLFFKYIYKIMFKRYGNNITWGRNFRFKCIPKTVRISTCEQIEIGDNCQIDDFVFLQCSFNGQGLHIGKGVRINYHSHILTHGRIVISNNVLIAPYCLISSGNHDQSKDGKSIMFQGHSSSGDITIEEGAWLGQGGTVLGGSHVGKNAIIGARAVVTKNVPSSKVFVGPAGRILE